MVDNLDEGVSEKAVGGEALWRTFSTVDKNGDGLITEKELQSVLKSLGLQKSRAYGECKKIIQKFDKDGDGKLNYMEFKEMMRARFGRN